MFNNMYSSLLSRMFDACVAIFSAALLLFLAVQLIIAVLWWLVAGFLILVVLGVLFAIWRYSHERW